MIANEDAARLESFRSKAELGFPLLVDENAQVIAGWGVANEERESLPHPATFVIDEEGIVLWRVVDPDSRQRPDTEQLLEALRSR